MKQVSLLIVALVLLSGCQEDTQDMGQTLAQVNGEHITASQYNALLRRLPPDSLTENERRRVASRMIDQEIAVQKALELKLDRQPRVLNQLEQARREILAGAFAEHIASTQPKPAASDVSNYFLEHPELFTERKIFQTNELLLPIELRENAAFVGLVKEGAEMGVITAWLSENDIAFRSTAAIRPAEKLPIQTLPRLNQAAPGDVVPFETEEAIILYFVIATQAAPLDWRKAEPAIYQHLEKTRSAEALETAVSAVKKQSDIRVFSEFEALLD